MKVITDPAITHILTTATATVILRTTSTAITHTQATATLGGRVAGGVVGRPDHHLDPPNLV